MQEMQSEDEPCIFCLFVQNLKKKLKREKNGIKEINKMTELRKGRIGVKVGE